jgi:peptidyl-prolyl cis-trans isomerase SurA
MSLDQLKSELRHKGVTYDEYREQIRSQIKKVKFVNQVISPEVKITDRDLRDYFQHNRTNIHGGTEVHLAEIVLPIGGITSEEQAIALRDKALSIVKQSRGNKKAFAQLAKKHSEGPNASKGGDLGVVKIGDLPERVAKTVKNMPEGAVSNPIPTTNAIVIVKIIDWPEISDNDFDAVRDNIHDKIYQVKLREAVNSYVMRLRQRAYIETRGER